MASESASGPALQRGPGRGRPKVRTDEASRAAIVEIARARFLEVGYGATIMDEIAGRCGISKRTLYRLFPTKADLFRAIVIQHRSAMLALPRPDDDVPLEQALAEIFRLDIPEAEDRERMAFIRLVVTDSAKYPEVERLLRDSGAAPARDMLAQWLDRQRERGRIEVDSAQMLARMLMDLVFGVFVRRFPDDDNLTAGDRRSHARLAFRIVLDGIRPRTKPVG